MGSAPLQVSPRIPPLRAAGALLIVSIGAALCWWIALGSMALLTAHEPLLNRDQILHSHYVVTGKTGDDVASGKVTVEHEWTTDGLKGTIVINNLASTSARPNSDYLLPLSIDDRGLRVTKTMLPNGDPLIYPATPTTVDQLKQILSSRH